MTSESLLFCMIYFQLSCLQNSKYFQACCFPNSNISNATLSELLDYPKIFHQSICKSYNLTDRYILFILAGFDGYILQILRCQIFSVGCLPNSDETPLGCLLSSNRPVSPPFQSQTFSLNHIDICSLNFVETRELALPKKWYVGFYRTRESQ